MTDKSNPFGFDGLNEGGLDLSGFEPKPKVVDRDKAAATRAVASESGFTRRAPAPAPVERTPAPVAAPAASPKPVAVAKAVAAAPPPVALKAKKRRVSISELLGIQDRYPDSERAQLNMLAPVPVVMRWRNLIRDAGDLPAWEVLEQAMDALEGKAKRTGKA